MLISRTPERASCRVRGIGVAVSVKTCTSALSCFNFSFCATPKCCSSSMIRRPRWANRTSLASSAWVPTTISTRPSVISFFTSRATLAGTSRDSAADQTVHRLTRSHVGKRVGDRVQLVLGFGIREAGREFLVNPLRGLQNVPRPQLALRGDTDQLAGNVTDALFDSGFARLPGDATKAIELYAGVFRPKARQDLDVLDRDKELVVTGIEHAHAIMRRASDVDRFERLVAADPVIRVDDKITWRQCRRLGDELIEAATPPRRAGQPVAENVLLAE